LAAYRPKILAAGIVTERELDDVDPAVREHLSDPGTLMLPHLLFLACDANRTVRRLPASARHKAAHPVDESARRPLLAGFPGSRCGAGRQTCEIG